MRAEKTVGNSHLDAMRLIYDARLFACFQIVGSNRYYRFAFCAPLDMSPDLNFFGQGVEQFVSLFVRFNVAIVAPRREQGNGNRYPFIIPIRGDNNSRHKTLPFTHGFYPILPCFGMHPEPDTGRQTDLN